MKHNEIRKYGVRGPVELMTTYRAGERFEIFGRTYERFEELAATPLHYSVGDPHRAYYEDVYGNLVLAIGELFPWKDLYDEMYERRMKRWYIVRKGKSLAVAYKADREKTFIVREYVRPCYQKLSFWFNEVEFLSSAAMHEKYAGAMEKREA